MDADAAPVSRCLSRRWQRHCRKAGRGLLILLLALLACAVLLRALVAMLEAAALLVLALAAASMALPHNLFWYWRQARRTVPRWLQDLARMVSEEPAQGSQKP